MSRRQRLQYAVRERSKRELRRSKETYCCLHIGFIVSLGLFFGLFFGITYPEIKLTDYVETECKIESLYTRTRYLCEKTCSSCSSSENIDPKCSNLINNLQNLNPLMCVVPNNPLNPQNNGNCPERDVRCNNDYHCCRRICHKVGNTNVCTCSSSVSNHLCYINCRVVYTAQIGFSFLENGSSFKDGLYENFFDTDKTGADNFLSGFDVGDYMTCFYDPQNPNTVLINDDYFTDWKIAILIIFGVLPLFICMVVYTKLLYGFTSIKKDYLWPITISTWFGVLVPFFILLPIMTRGYKVNKTDMSIAIGVLVIFGNAPFLVKLFIDYSGIKKDNSDKSETSCDHTTLDEVPIENEDPENKTIVEV